jgi:hypothetical protein
MRKIRAALNQTVAVVTQNNSRAQAWHEASKSQLEATEWDIPRPQQMILREDQFFADVDQRQLCAISEHRLNEIGTNRSQHRRVRQSEKLHLALSRLLRRHLLDLARF